jgi:mRNA interferase HigB
MHVITRKALLAFSREHPQAYGPLDSWFRLIKSRRYETLADLKRDFPTADYVRPWTVFNIGGNKYRLIAVVRHDTQRVYIRWILTHAEYDKGDWKNGNS